MEGDLAVFLPDSQQHPVAVDAARLIEGVAEPEDRVDLVVVVDDLVALGCPDVVGAGDLGDILDRDAVLGAADLDEHDLHDRHGHRQPEGDGRPLAKFAFDVDRPVKLFDGVVDDIHPDAAAAHVGDLLGRREARMEDQIVDLRLLHPFELAFGFDAFLDGLLLEHLRIETGTVVGDLDVDVIAVAGRRQRDVAGWIFALLLAFLRRLDPVVDRVAQHVDQGVADLGEDGAVELDILAGDGEVHLFAGLTGDIPHQPREGVDDLRQRDEPHVHRRILEVAGDLVELVEVVGVDPLPLHLPAELDPARHKLFNEIVELVELVDIDPHRLDVCLVGARTPRPGAIARSGTGSATAVIAVVAAVAFFTLLVVLVAVGGVVGVVVGCCLGAAVGLRRFG